MSVDRDCLYCSNTFKVGPSHRLFCSDTCKNRYNRENSSTCFYCGELADSKDHITPQSFSDPGLPKFFGREVVNCCRECNTLLWDHFPNNLIDRIQYLIDKIFYRYNLDKPTPEWDDEEIEELGPTLREHIKNKINERQKAIDRIWYMKDTINNIRSNEGG